MSPNRIPINIYFPQRGWHILHQPLIEVESVLFDEKPQKSVRESCIRILQTRRTPLQTHAEIPGFQNLPIN
jgi:hypothetical protein